jgi:hypothetical protein
MMEATTTRRRRTATPFTRAWNQAKKLDEKFADMDKELYTPEEAYEMTMKDIKAIFDDATV